MRPICCVIAGVVLAFTFTGCSESAPEGGPVQYKGTSSAQIEGLRKQMSDNAKGKNGLKRPEAETKPAPDTKAAEKKG
jgi:hypothetical protein